MNDILKDFGENLSKTSGFIAMSIVDIKTGISYYSNSGKTNYDIDTATNFAIDIVRAKLNSINVLKQTQHIDEIVVVLTSQIDIIDVSKNNEYFIYFIVDSTIANLTITKALLTKYKKEIIQSKEKT